MIRKLSLAVTRRLGGENQDSGHGLELTAIANGRKRNSRF